MERLPNRKDGDSNLCLEGSRRVIEGTYFNTRRNDLAAGVFGNNL